MSEWLNNLLLLVIFAAYCQFLAVLAFLAGQLMILVIEYAADRIERRQSHAGKSLKAVAYRKGYDRERAVRS